MNINQDVMKVVNDQARYMKANKSIREECVSVKNLLPFAEADDNEQESVLNSLKNAYEDKPAFVCDMDIKVSYNSADAMFTLENVEETSKISKAIYKEIAGIYADDEGTTNAVLYSLRDSDEFINTSERQRETINTILGSTHLGGRGVYKNGCKYYYDENLMEFKRQDACLCNIMIANVRNRPVANIEFTDKVASVTGFGCQRTNKNAILSCGGEVLDDRLAELTITDTDGNVYDGIDGTKVRFDNGSVKTFYSFDRYDGHSCCFVKLTKSLRDTYWNSDCPLYYRFDINDVGNANYFGISNVVWSYYLFEASYSGVYLDENAELSDLKDLCLGYEDTYLAGELMHKYDLLHNTTKEEKERRNIEAQKNISDVQKVIDDNTSTILEKTLKGLKMIPVPTGDMVQQLRNLEHERYSRYFDCGFVYYAFMDTDKMGLMKDASSCENSFIHNDGSFSLNEPFQSQSLTIMSVEAKIICDMLKTKGFNVRYKTVLD